MSDIKKCPVCHSEISLNADVCPICGMNGLNRVFLNSTEYDMGVREVLNPQIKKYKELSFEDAGKRFGVSQMLDPYDNYVGGPIPLIERKKYSMSVEVVEYINENKFLQAADLSEKIALICHNQGKERDAYLLEHKAFLYRQEHFCREAGFLTDVFGEVPDRVPYVEILQNTLTRLAEKYHEEQKDYFALCKLINARLCRAMGKEKDALLLEDTVRKEVGWDPESMETTKFVDRFLEGKEPEFMQMLIEEYIKDFNRLTENE